MLRIQLISNTIGSIVIEKNSPVGINELTQTVKRSKEAGVIFEVILDLEFIKAGRRFIKRAYEETGRIDAEVFVNIYERDYNAKKWRLWAEGRINFNKYELEEDRVTVNIEQVGFQRRVLNLFETDVDLETTESENGTAIPSIEMLTPEYHSKTILKSYSATPTDVDPEDPFTVTYQQLNVLGEDYPTCATPGGCTRGFDQTAYGQVDTGKIIFDEIPETFTLPWGFSQDPNRPSIITFSEAGTIKELEVSLRLKHSIASARSGGDIDFCGDSDIGFKEVKAWFLHKRLNGDIVTSTSFGTWSSNVGCGAAGAVGEFETKIYTATDVDIQIGDQIFVYYTFRVYGDYTQSLLGAAGRIDYHLSVQAEKAETYIRVRQETTFAPTQNKTVFLHDAIEKCCQFITNQVDCFRSDLLGRTERGYDVDGEYGLLGYTSGNWLRGRSDKKLFTNLKELIDFINSIACVGFGFEYVDGKYILRVEKISYFYNKNTKILSLSGVAKIKKKLLPKNYYNSIEYGYAEKLDVSIANAIDEFNTLRRSIIPITNTKNILKVATKVITGGYPIEVQRRLSISTEDGKQDDKNFGVILTRNLSIFVTKKDEGYETITGVTDPSSGYNYDISPARNLRNWFQVVASSLVGISNKVLKFSFGEVNYVMTSKKTAESFIVAEDGNVDLSNVEPIWENEAYEFSHPLSRDEFMILKNSPYGYIEFTDRFGEKFEGFINDERGVDHDPNKGVAEFDLLRVHRP
jgi:hypothetical protein